MPVPLGRVDLENARVVQAVRALVLVHEGCPGRGAAPGCRVQDLQRNIGVRLRIKGTPDLALAAHAQTLAQHVAHLQGLSAVRRGRFVQVRYPSPGNIEKLTARPERDGS